MVGRENSVDTQVSTRVAPAVEQENVIVTKRSIQHDSVTIETHNHEVFHRVQPVIEREVLPARHFMPSADGKTLVEIPASQIPKTAPAGMKTHEIHGQHVVPPPRLPHPPTVSRPGTPATTPAATPVTTPAATEETGPAWDESTTRPQPVKPTKNAPQPVLASKKEYVTEAGHPKTEYVWHHPPVMQNEDNSRPVDISASVGDLHSPPYSSDDEEDLAGARFGASAGKSSLPFRESDDERPERLSGLAPQGHDYREHEPKGAESLTNKMKNMRM